jgi:hypothetical protein
MPNKEYGNPKLTVRIPRKLLRRYKVLAKHVYGATVPDFTRDMLAAIVDADKSLQPFLARLMAGMARVQAEEAQGKLNLSEPPHAPP